MTVATLFLDASIGKIRVLQLATDVKKNELQHY
jgi:hypothetical protein